MAAAWLPSGAWLPLLQPTTHARASAATLLLVLPVLLALLLLLLLLQMRCRRANLPPLPPLAALLRLLRLLRGLHSPVFRSAGIDLATIICAMNSDCVCDDDYHDDDSHCYDCGGNTYCYD